ncbi:MAG: hypothetical protein CHACPFDD_02023 [Phycisphaerae bacterium]|nr:hypothetical protein [Phycisphaerae bacterium]
MFSRKALAGLALALAAAAFVPSALADDWGFSIGYRHRSRHRDCDRVVVVDRCAPVYVERRAPVYYYDDCDTRVIYRSPRVYRSYRSYDYSPYRRSSVRYYHCD